MRNETRQKFNEFTGKVAKLNAITSAMVQFNVQPSVQQTLETKMQESVAGSSPRTRGTGSVKVKALHKTRFIPADAGNS